MISVIFSTRQDNPEYQEHIKNTIGVKDYETIQIINNNQYSLTEAYNMGLKNSVNDIVAFIHDDLVLPKDWGKKMLKHFEESDYGILGVAGTTNMPESGQWWEDSTKMVGIVKHSHEGKTWENKYSNSFGDGIIETVMVDGLFFVIDKTKVIKPFNEDIKGFHFYDVDFTFYNHLHGVRVGVVFDVRITHKSIGMTNNEWQQNRLQFCELNHEHLPHNLQVELHYEKEVKKLPKKFPKLGIVIPTKGNVDMLKDCVDSIWEKDGYFNMKVYIADTGSTDEEKERIRQDIIFRHSLFSDRPRTIELIEYDYYNFASINNDVVRNHIDEDTELILFCNNDIKLVNDAITRMVNVYNQNKKQVGTIGARLHFGDNTIQHSGISVYLNQQPQTGAYFPTLTHYGLKSYYTYHDGQKEVLGNTAAFMMINKDLFDKIGGFNEEYNECFEDVHLNIDCLRFNRKNIFVGDAVCYHLESQTRNKDEDKQRRESEDYVRRIIPYIVNNKKTYKYFVNVKEDVLTQILNKQSNEIRSII